MDKLRQMQIFVQVIESGNFTRAAQVLGCPRSTVSTLIQALEDRLGTQLLIRTTRQVKPTPDGIVFYEHSSSIIADVAFAEDLFHHAPRAISGRIRVGMPSRIGRKIVIPALGGFMEDYPDLRIDLSLSDRMVDLVSEGVDCVIRAGHGENSEIICRKLGDLPMVNCASPAYLEKYGLPEQFSDLAEHLLVNCAPGLPAATPEFEAVQEGKTKSIAMRSRIAVDNADAYIAAALAGYGIVQIPQFDVRSALQEGRLIEILPGLRAAPLQLSGLFAQRRNLPFRVRLFLDWLQARLKVEGVI